MKTIYLTYPGTKISYRRGKLRIMLPSSENVVYPIQTIKEIFVISRVNFSGRALKILLSKEIPVYFLTSSAKFLGQLAPYTPHNIPLKLKHFKFFIRNKEIQTELAQKTLITKVKNSYTIMLRWYRNRGLNPEPIKRLVNYTLEGIKRTNNHEELLGFEGFFARRYYEEWAEIVPANWKFKKRTKRPPKDPVNAMLSFGYTVLFNKMQGYLITKGLEPYFGFLHKIKYDHPALASDLMEEFRSVIVDSAVMEIISKKRLDPKLDFYPKDKGIVMERKAIKVLLNHLNKRFTTTYKINNIPYSYEDLINKKINSYIKVIKKEDVQYFFTFTTK